MPEIICNDRKIGRTSREALFGEKSSALRNLPQNIQSSWQSAEALDEATQLRRWIEGAQRNGNAADEYADGHADDYADDNANADEHANGCDVGGGAE